MALTLSAITSSAATLSRRRLPIVGTLCFLTFGLSNLSIPFTKTGVAHSLPFAPLLRSKLGGERGSTSVSRIRMEASTKIVPSIVVYVTVPNKELGKKLAGSIVNEKLAACVNRVSGIESVHEWQGEIQTDSEELLIIKTRESLLEALTEHVKANHEYETVKAGLGIESVHEWQGEIQTDSEELLIIKTRESLLEALTEHVKANHEYDVPEVIAMPIVGGSPQYLEWLKNSTKDK